jgi:cytochrome c oxidase subunit 3
VSNNNEIQENEPLKEVRNDNFLTLKQEEKVKTNLMWVAIFSIIMLFAGITSGYIVASGTDFWLNLKLPTQFTISTTVILLSSFSLWGATHFVKQNKLSLATPLIGITLILGLSFGYFQYKGFSTMHNQGSSVVGGVINIEGKYGEYYTLYYQNKEISFDGNDYYWQGKKVDSELMQKMIDFNQSLEKVAKKDEQQIKNYGAFMLKYKGEPVILQNNKLTLKGNPLTANQKQRLYRFSDAIVTGRGDFIMIGKYGEDFTLNYKGKPVEYKNRKFYQNGQELSEYQLNKLYSSQNRTSSFIIAFVFIHILHWLAGITVLIVLFIKALKHKYTPNNHIGLKVGSIYWHFLGILWLYLYLFLIFFH